MTDKPQDQTLGKYQIVEEIGRGGFATVYRAVDTTLDRQVALKVLDPLLMRDQNWVTRFQREARAVARLKHPHIITIHEIGEADGQLFITMELVEGPGLDGLIAERGSLPWEETLEILGQVAEALDYAHGEGIVHRDLKPANILLDPRRGAVLTDFGFARLVGESSMSVSLSGGVVGTPAYIAPEVWKDKETGPATDVYSLGCVLFEMLMGERMFTGDSSPAVMMAHFEPHQYPDEWPEGVPPAMEGLLERALAADPTDRYPGPGALAADLKVLAVRAADPLALPYGALEAALAAENWEQASQFAQEIMGQDSDYRHVQALARQAAAGQAGAEQARWAAQWREQALAAERAGKLEAARVAVQRWLEMAPEDPQARALLDRLAAAPTKAAEATPSPVPGRLAGEGALEKGRPEGLKGVTSPQRQGVPAWAGAPAEPARPARGFPWEPVIAGALLLLLCGSLAGLAWLTGGLRPHPKPAATDVPTSKPSPQPGETPRKPTPSPDTAPSGAQVLVVAGGDPPTLDPHLSGDATSAEYIVEIFSGLVNFDRDLNLIPDLAERWEISEDGRVYTFYLRENARFHDGKPVGAEDFKWSFERACDPKTGSFTADTYLGDVIGCRDKLSGETDEVDGIQVVDDTTIEITIDRPRSYFLSKLTFPVSYVLDRKNVERGGANWTDDPNGTGPFKLDELRHGERVVLERNEDYYREPKPRLDRVEFMLMGGSAMVMYEQGDLDVTGVSLNDIDRVSDPTNPLSEDLHKVDSMGVFYVGLNTSEPPFDDVKVRQAFNHALDRERIVNVVYKKTRPVAWGIVPPSMPHYDNPDLKPLEYDPEQALELIADSKYGDVTEFPDITFNVLGAGGSVGRIVEAIVASYEENLGVPIEVQQTDWATFLSDLNRPDNTNQMWGGEAGWIADYPDPHNFLDVLFRCDSSQNHTGYCNPDVDELLDQAAAEDDPAAREKLYRQVEQIVIDEAPWVPLFFEVEYWLVKPYVQNAFLPPMVMPKHQYYHVAR